MRQINLLSVIPESYQTESYLALLLNLSPLPKLNMQPKWHNWKLQPFFIKNSSLNTFTPQNTMLSITGNVMGYEIQ